MEEETVSVFVFEQLGPLKPVTVYVTVVPLGAVITIEEPVAPLLQLYVLAPLAFNETVPLGHAVTFGAETTGGGPIKTVALVTPAHPGGLLPVNVYTVVEDGETFIEEELELVLQV